MFTIEDHRVEFEHKPDLMGALTGEMSGKTLPYRGVTFCLLDGEVVGVAYCSIKDIYSKNTGRKEALKDALDGLGYPRPIRAEFWTEYAAARGGKWA